MIAKRSYRGTPFDILSLCSARFGGRIRGCPSIHDASHRTRDERLKLVLTGSCLAKYAKLYLLGKDVIWARCGIERRKTMEAQKAGGIIESVKEWAQSFDAEKIFGPSSSDAVQVAVGFVSFFAIGFLFKKYLKFIFMSLLFSLLIIKGLEYYKVLDVDWEALNTLLGFEPQMSLSELGNKALEWVKVNLVITASSLLGFFVGYKLG